MKTLVDMVRGLRLNGRRPAVGMRGDYGVRWWSYRALSRRIQAGARALDELGLEPGDRLVLAAPNSPEWTALFLAAAWRGLVVVPVDPATSAERMRSVVDRVEARVIVRADGDGDGASAAPALEQRLMTLLEDDAGRGEDLAPIELDATDPVAILFTSGSSGEPKGVVLTQQNLMFQTRRFQPLRPLTRLFRFRLLSLSPLSHVQGLMLGLFVPLSLGLAVVYSRSAAPYHLMRTIRGNRIHALSTVPRVLELLETEVRTRPTGRRRASLDARLKRARWPLTRKILTMRAVRLTLGFRFMVLLVGGASLPGDRERFWRRAARVLIQGYGLTETTAFVSLERPWPTSPGSIGKPIAEQELAVAEDGELLVRGPHLTPAYFGSGAPALPLTEDGFFRTGDLVRRGRGGRLHFLGRKNDMLVTAEGHNVHPDEVERVLATSAAVREAVVLSGGKDGLDEIHAVLLLGTGADAAAEVRRANRMLESSHAIRGWSVWPQTDFPRGALGKVDRKRVAEALPALRAGQPTVAAPEDDAPPSLDQALSEPDPDRRLEAIADYVAATRGDVSVGQLATEIGLDSISTIRLLMLLERKWKVPLAQRVVTPGTSFAELFAGGGADDDRRGGGANASPIPFGESKEPPRWQQWEALVPIRRLLRDLLLLPPLTWRLRLRVRGLTRLAALEPPLLLTMDTDNRRSRLDFLALYAALPRRLRRRVAVVTGRWIFGAYLDPTDDKPLWVRLWASLLFNFGMPLLLPFVVVPPTGSTMRGLLSAGRWIDRRHNLIMTLGPGTGLLASETGVPAVPVHLRGNEALDSGPARRPEVTVSFGAPLAASPTRSGADLEERIEAALRELAAEAAAAETGA